MRMDDKPKNKIGGTIITGALIFGGIGFLLAIFLDEPWHSYIGMIIGFATGGADCSWWLMSRRKRKRPPLISGHRERFDQVLLLLTTTKAQKEYK